MSDSAAFPYLVPFQAEVDRIAKITVCTRPFRAIGPRVEAEQVAGKLVVHNYGHGGAGWSLSWGSGEVALDLALAGRVPSRTDMAVVGCGALGITAAIVAQRAGAKSVTIYSKDQPNATRSFNATGSYTPFSRIALRTSATPAFGDLWERIARTTFATHRTFLNAPGIPIEFTDRFYLSDSEPDIFEQQLIDQDPIGFVNYRDRIADLNSPVLDFGPGTHPFPRQWVRQRSEMMFNITGYAQHLTEEFQRNGGRIVQREFHSPAEFATLPQSVILHCTGYAARKLFGDDSLIPVRGQIGWLPPRPEMNYGLYFDFLGVLSRRDGVVVQLNGKGEQSGWNDDTETPDHEEAANTIRMIQTLYANTKHS